MTEVEWQPWATYVADQEESESEWLRWVAHSMYIVESS